jgi:hypothetical protein
MLFCRQGSNFIPSKASKVRNIRFFKGINFIIKKSTLRNAEWEWNCKIIYKKKILKDKNK